MVRLHLGPFEVPFGDVAQLGERGLCKAEVGGSTPLISTNNILLFDNWNSGKGGKYTIKLLGS